MDSSTEWYTNIRFRWIVLPVMAYILSWSVTWGVLWLFPVLVTVSYYLIFSVHPAVARPGFWFFTLPVTFYIWAKWGPAIAHLHSNGVYYGVLAYYLGQLANTLFIPLMIHKGQPEFLLNWIVSNLAALVVWLSCYKLFIAGWVGNEVAVAGDTALFITYPAIALAANGISSFFFTKSLRSD